MSNNYLQDPRDIDSTHAPYLHSLRLLLQALGALEHDTESLICQRVLGMQQAVAIYRQFVPEMFREAADKAYESHVKALDHCVTSTHQTHADASANSSRVSRAAARTEGF